MNELARFVLKFYRAGNLRRRISQREQLDRVQQPQLPRRLKNFKFRRCDASSRASRCAASTSLSLMPKSAGSN